MLHHHARLREGPQVKELLTGRRTAVVCVGALGRGASGAVRVYGGTWADVQAAAAQVLDQARVICVPCTGHFHAAQPIPYRWMLPCSDSCSRLEVPYSIKDAV